MIPPGTNSQFFHTSAELQEFLLTQPPGVVVIVPHLRLAHQVWRRQRLAARAAGRAAWEPVAMTTLSGWFQQLWRQLWLPVRPATVWQRLVFWLQAMEAIPPEEEISVDLSWAALLDEAFDLCQRYRLPSPDGLEADSPLITWRQAMYQKFSTILREHGLISPAAVPDFLREALRRGELALPDQIVLVGFETPAPVEQEWLDALVKYLPVIRVHLAGRQEEEISLKGVVFPDRRQEMEWVAAKVLELAQAGVPLHRLAVTAPNLESYLPDLRRLWQELLGQAVTGTGGCYNFSLGPTLSEAQLFHAALLPLKFIISGEQRQDLIGWLRSPYYGAFGRHDKNFLHWDKAWRKYGPDHGWIGLRQVIAGNNGDDTPHPDFPQSMGEGKGAISAQGGRKENRATDKNLLGLIDQALSLLPRDQAPADLWRARLLEMWRLLEFPHCLDSQEAGQWQAWLTLLNEFAAAGGERPWTAAVMVEWLSWGAARLDLTGDGSVDTGVQIQGLLELRGLDFEAVFCLGLNMGVFPPPPRHLPLLTSREKTLVLGGDYQSQGEFAKTSYRYLLAAAPQLILTRPVVDQEEEQLASHIIPSTIWEKDPIKFSALSQAHPAWLRSPAVQAAFLIQASGLTPDLPELIPIPLPEQMSLSALETALTCPCRFFLNKLLGLEELPDLEPGLTAQERGTIMHRVLQDFTERYLKTLQDTGVWDDVAAWQDLQAVIAEHQPDSRDNPHWEAEIGRWLAEPGGVLREWLEQEKQRFREGWRWLAMEDSFAGLRLPGWPMSVRGRLDRIDTHPTEGLMLWDYKTGNVLKQKEIEEDRGRFQLLGYLLAVRQGLTRAKACEETRAGIIGLKSSRTDHLKYEDFKFSSADWQKVLEEKLRYIAEIGQRVGKGDFRPDPSQPPPAQSNSCKYCPLNLLCGYRAAQAGDEAE